MKRRYIVGLLLTLLISTVALPSVTAGERIEMPQGVYYYQPAASVFGSEAVWINPAALSRFRISGFQFMADYFDGNYAKSWGSVVSRDGLALTYRKLHNPDGPGWEDYILGVGIPVGKQFSIGASYFYFREGPGIFNNRHFWNFAAMYRPGGAFSWAAVFSNVNRGKIDGERSETEQRYSMSYRPREIDLTVSMDMMLSTGMKLSSADFVYHAEFSPTTGLYVNGYLDNDRNFQIGVRANFARYFLGSRRSSDKSGHHRGTTAFVGANNRKQPSITRHKVRRLAVSLAGRPSENPPRPVFGKQRTSFLSILLEIYRAAEDPSIGEMVLSLNRLSMGMGQAQEIREAIRYFRSTGKTVTCHISFPGNLSYYVASVCDKILIPPVSQLNLVGLRAELTFFAGTLEKLGVRAEIVRIGDYKTAPERYTEKSSTEANREQVNKLLDDLFDQFVSGIAEGRNLPFDSVTALIDKGPFTSVEALELGLVDGLSYRDDLRDGVLEKMPEISLRRYQSDTLIHDDWYTKPAIAVVVADGEMAFDGEGMTPFSEDTDVTPGKMRGAFARAESDSRIKGVVFRINSPGGMALAGDEIYHAAEKASRRKPITVSMASMASSGGYYVAMPAEHVLADPATITGSIGIYGGKVDLSGLYDKIDLNKELYTRGKYAGMLTTMRPFTDDEREKYASQLEAMYGHFLSLVAENRNLPVDSIDNLAQGRVFTGREALSSGLVDSLGGIKQALDFTAARLGLREYDVELLPRKRPLFLLPGKSIFSAIGGFLGIGNDDSVPGALPGHSASEGILARIPYDIDIQ